MPQYDVTFGLLGHETAWAITVGVVVAHDKDEAAQKARAYLQTQQTYALGSLLEVAELPMPGDREWGHVHLRPRRS